MVSVTEASTIIQNYLWQSAMQQVPLLQSRNRILLENIFADRDFPPFNRVTMDGIAIAFESWESGQKTFELEGVLAAGIPQQKLKSSASCLEVMTGAILPEGTDTVVKYEDLKITGKAATVLVEIIRKGEHIHVQGSDARQGDVILTKGTLISAAEIPLMASVGRSSILVSALPKTALVSTGDELVNIDETPQLHQIRKSNVYALAAGLNRYGIEPDLFHLKDNEISIHKSLSEILGTHDLVILSGGVSKGKFDFIPTILGTLGIQKHFHQVKQRPGKPIWFGTGKNKTVFALPGNPVSTFLCFYQYIEPWLIKSVGANPSPVKAILDTDFTFDAPLTYFLQVKIKNMDGKLLATPIPGGGSGDFVNLKEVDGFIELPEGEINFAKNSVYNFISFRK